jgi:hypothetical protein
VRPPLPFSLTEAAVGTYCACSPRYYDRHQDYCASVVLEQLTYERDEILKLYSMAYAELVQARERELVHREFVLELVAQIGTNRGDRRRTTSHIEAGSAGSSGVPSPPERHAS